TMPRARFLGTGLAVPDRVVTNDELSRVMNTSDEWIRSRTGIQERRWVREGETSAALAHAASLRAIEAAGLAPADHDAIVYADERGILAFDLHGDGSHAEKLWVDAPGSMYHPRVSAQQLEEGRHFLEMDGKEVFRHAVVRMPESVHAVLAATGHTTSDLALLI